MTPTSPLRGLPMLSVLALLGCQHATAPAPATPTSTTTALRCPDGMVLIAAGEVEAGDDPRRSFDPRLRQRERVERAFCIERTEVSVEAYRRCVADRACTEPVPHLNADGNGDRLCNWGRPGAEGHPVNCVNVWQARMYCAWSGGDRARRLPHELEWELAARGATGRTFPWGEDAGDGSRANFCGAECERFMHGAGFPAVTALPGWTDSAEMTAPVDAFSEGATPEGVLNLAGNVGEFVDASFQGRQSVNAVIPGPAEGFSAIVRGGSMLTTQPRSIRAAARTREVPTGYSAGVGLRCAVDAR